MPKGYHHMTHDIRSQIYALKSTLQELQQLGGWSSFEMVLRYAHLSGDHLRDAANRITGLRVAYCNQLAGRI